MDRRVVLAFGGLAVLAAAVILFVALHTDPDLSARPSRSPDPEVVLHSGSARPVPIGSRRTGSGNGEREYMVDGVRVRDRRTSEPGEQAPSSDLPRPVRQPDGRELPSTITQDVSRRLQAVMAECRAQIPATARNKKSHLKGMILVAIKQHQLSITEAAMELRDVEAEAAAAVKLCMEAKAVGITADVPEQADLERYSISVSFSF